MIIDVLTIFLILSIMVTILVVPSKRPLNICNESLILSPTSSIIFFKLLLLLLERDLKLLIVEIPNHPKNSVANIVDNLFKDFDVSLELL